MIKTFTLTILFTIIVVIGLSQESHSIDSFKHELAIAKEDTNKVFIMSALCYDYTNSKPDSAKMYGEMALNLARRIKYPKGEVRSLNNLSRVNRILGDIPTALEIAFKALPISENNHYRDETKAVLNGIGVIYTELKDYTRAKAIFFKAEKITDDSPGRSFRNLNFNLYINTCRAFRENNQPDSALLYLQKAAKSDTNLSLDNQTIYLIENARSQFQLGNHQAALDNLHKSIAITLADFNHRRTSIGCNVIAIYFKELNKPDSAIYFAKTAIDEARAIGFKRGILDAAKLLSELYEPANLNEAHYYLKLTYEISEELFGENKIRELQKTVSDEQERHREIEAAKIASQNRQKQYIFLAGLGILLLIAFILYRSNRQKHKDNKLLHQQKEEIQQTISQLKATQSQLIQSEKMASLGELTAGIAHEIQNPLNFVNNFSEVNKEMLEELKAERLKPVAERDEQAESEIIEDVIANSEKINHHGKRADAIVKGMLQHSQATTGQKEATDVNKLSDEYLRLAYHGLRAKDNSFNATLKTYFDETIGNINIIPQDIGRVLLNIYNNAFYAVDEKKKSGINNYVPTVSVNTKKITDKVEIKITDNGNGIPQKIVDKIFQPFFTTKPTGQGTGLGLSLSYDIIKAHGGEIKIITKEGEGAEFIIHLPQT